MINYAGLKWLGANEAQLIDKSRKILLQSLASSVKYSFSQNKLHTGKLSKGCLMCGQGYWSCLHINSLCTANCFYCPQNRKRKKESLPRAEYNVVFANSEDYAAYLKKFGFKGVGFSGGEPFLVFEKLLTYIKEINRKLGDDFYIWVYTNGDLVTKDKLKALKEAGSEVCVFMLKYKEEKWFRATFTSVNDMYDEVSKVIFIANEITNEKIMEAETRLYEIGYLLKGLFHIYSALYPKHK